MATNRLGSLPVVGPMVFACYLDDLVQESLGWSLLTGMTVIIIFPSFWRRMIKVYHSFGEQVGRDSPKMVPYLRRTFPGCKQKDHTIVSH